METHRLIDHICKELCECDHPCTSVGEYVTTKVVEQASQKIFDDPDRAFVELVLNSIDAYRQLVDQPSVGKFGMGFYSIFTYIIDQPKSGIIITSHTLDEHWESVITSRDGQLYFTMVDILPDQPGTKITIYGPASEDIDMWIVNKYLKYVSGVQIRLTTCYSWPCETETVNIDTQPTWPTIEIYQMWDDKPMLYVEDHATGINRQTYLQTMLIPGVSTKEIQFIPMPMTYLGLSTGYHPSKDETYLYILVGEISIFIQSIDIPGYIFVIQMPRQSNLPVSRDRLLPTEDNIRIYNQQVDYLIQNIFQNDIQLLPILSKLVHSVYEVWGQPPWMVDHLDRLVDSLPNQSIYYVPQIHMQVFTLLPLKWRFVYVPEEDVPVRHFLDLENRLYQEPLPWVDDLFQGRRVLILPGLTSVSTSAGFGRFLFLREYPQDIQKFILAYPEDQLTPFEIDIQFTYRELISTKLHGLQTYFQTNDAPFQVLVANLPEDLTPIYYAELCLYLNVLIKNVLLSTGYTQGQLNIEFYNFPNGESHISPKMVDYFRVLIHDQFTYFKKNLRGTIPNIWIRQYFPPRHAYLVEHTADPYEYLALACMNHVDKLEEHLPILQRYWQTKLNNSYRRQELLTWKPSEGETEIGKILMDVYTEVVGLDYHVYSAPVVRRSLSTYKLSELLRRVYDPDFYPAEIYTLETHQTTTSQLIPIAINQAVVNPLERVLVILNQTFPQVNFNLYRGNGQSVIRADVQQTLNQLLYNSLPYASPFLPIYGLASRVEIYHSGIALIDTPIKRGDLVVDIQRNVHLTLEDRSYVAVHLPTISEDDLLNGSTFIKHALCLLRPVNYHGETYSVAKELIFSSPLGDLWVIPRSKTSWIFRDGQPEIPVDRYHGMVDILHLEDVRGYINKGYLFNIKSVTPINEDEFYYAGYMFERDAVYYALLHNLIYRGASYANKYISNIISGGDYRQLKFKTMYTRNRLHDFLENHSPNLYPSGRRDGLSIGYWINKIIDSRDGTPVDDIPEIEDLPTTIQEVIKHWFMNKYVRESTDVAGYGKATDVVGYVYPMNEYVEEHLQHFVGVWWSIVQTLSIPEVNLNQQSPRVRITSEDIHADGKYSVREHEIILPYTGDYRNYLQEDVQWENIIVRGDPYITNIFPPAILIHELYHAVLGNDHAGGHHPVTMTINGIQEEYPFNAGAMEIYREILLHDLVARLE